MERNHTLTVIETVFELLPPGNGKTAILFQSHTFQGVTLGVTENLSVIMMMMMMMMTVSIIKPLIIIIGSCIK